MAQAQHCRQGFVLQQRLAIHVRRVPSLARLVC
uniref:Uncharacterized protein n=1 Tax=Anguilla anguilla TaxID=7936 RepID=A0A0E9U3R3_ANGAN